MLSVMDAFLSFPAFTRNESRLLRHRPSPAPFEEATGRTILQLQFGKTDSLEIFFDNNLRSLTCLSLKTNTNPHDSSHLQNTTILTPQLSP